MSYGNMFGDLKQSLKVERLSGVERALRALKEAGFTEQQSAAVVAEPGSEIIVSAGAGAGKTKTLTERVCWLLEQGVNPRDVLVCTFTKAASTELVKRIKQRMPTITDLPACGTVHSVALGLLGGMGGLETRGLALMDEQGYESRSERLALDAPETLKGLSAKDLLLLVQRCQEERQGPADLQLLTAHWEESLRSEGLCDFVMLLQLCLKEQAPRNFKHILCDEAQDLTQLQLDWIHHFMAPGATLYLCGDDDQSLYSFRGTAKGVLACRVTAGARLYMIDRNFRCARKVLEHANNVIAFNTNRLAGRLIPNRKDEGIVEVLGFATGVAEADAAALALSSRRSHAVLVRTREMLAPFEALGLNAKTIHESKGLEWDHVWVAGVELGVLPHSLGDREEERRLCYVAMTRARNSLTMSYAAERFVNGRMGRYSPSPFLYETQALDVR